MTWLAYYTSADSAEPGSTWSVYVERYESVDSAEPIDGSQKRLGSYADEHTADGVALAMQMTAEQRGGRAMPIDWDQRDPSGYWRES